MVATIETQQVDHPDCMQEQLNIIVDKELQQLKHETLRYWGDAPGDEPDPPRNERSKYPADDRVQGSDVYGRGSGGPSDAAPAHGDGGNRSAVKRSSPDGRSQRKGVALMCPSCGLGNVRVSSLLQRDEGESALFTCQECGWTGDAKTFRVPCTGCGDSVPWAQIELDHDCNVVCRPCYLREPPVKDILGLYHDTQIASAAPKDWLN
jgi:predicted RNA-binding Zn-ribbon protein involved in translation (DUF1610 family)